MAESKLPKFDSLEELGNFFDKNDMGDYLQAMPEVEFEVDIKSSRTYFAVESSLSVKLRKVAKQQGVSAETLLNLWLQERIGQEQPDAA